MSSRQYNNSKGDSLNFEDTYLGYSDEEEDAFNDATFGGNVDMNSDFNFGGDSASSAPFQTTVNYAQAAATKPNQLPLNDDPLKPIESLWGGSAPSVQSATPAQAPTQPLSVDEIEAQLTTGGSPSGPIQQHQQQPQQQFQQHPPQSFVQPPGFLNYPPGFLQTQPGALGPQGVQGPPGYSFPPQFNLSQIPPQQFAQLPPQIQQQLLFQHQQQQQQFQQQQQQQQQHQQFQQQQLAAQQQQQQQQKSPLKQQPELQQAQPQQQEPQQLQEDPVQQLPQHRQPPQQRSQGHADLSEFPVLGSEEAASSKIQHQDHHQDHRQPQEHQQQNQPRHQQQAQHNTNRRYNNQYGPQHHENFNELPEEEKQRLMRRQQKVQRILQFTGIMHPRDKDFVTRVQLSHIVTDDPYNEDFYFQVYRLLKSGEQNTNNNSIAQAYLDFSGHKLGGRYQRADLALQRMQQQVQKAVTVAKSKPKAAPLTKGALGKIPLLSARMPRKQLEIIGKKPELPEVSKGGRKATLLQLEDIYQQVLSLESEEREQKKLNTEPLWESLKLFDDSQQLNPFIQVLSYEKGLKIFPRLFHFLNRQQRLTIVTLLFANLSLIKIISKSSFKNHENDDIPSDVQKTIELFQLVVLKPVILFLSYEAILSEVIGLLTILIEHNNISFLSTSKLGISLITILLSRAEIIKQEQTVSSEDLSQWSDAYDKLFSSLETKIPLIFPSSKLNNFDDSYIWQFLASLALSGKINHQRIIVDEIRDEIFGSIKKAKESETSTKIKIINNLNLFLNVIGLSATEDEIVELK